ncbi:MAG TPA: sigma-70 family RNA polymerase sigma factor [Chloroflexota bacterium]|nr:sigma-70 family RNA polymerase sigma factor [Chloroflexota bacterium]
MGGQYGDDLLIARARQGDVAAFNGLVERYQGLAYSVAYRTLGDAEAAADATQDAFLAAFNAIRGFRGGEPFRARQAFTAWLLRIVTNACFDIARRAQRRPSTSLDRMLEERGEAATDRIVDPDPPPEGEALRAELIEQIQEALLQLPFDQRTAVVLSDLHGLSYDEVAETTSTSLGTVKSRIARGRAKLRDLLGARPELSPGSVRP